MYNLLVSSIEQWWCYPGRVAGSLFGSWQCSSFMSSWTCSDHRLPMHAGCKYHNSKHNNAHDVLQLYELACACTCSVGMVLCHGGIWDRWGTACTDCVKHWSTCDYKHSWFCCVHMHVNVSCLLVRFSHCTYILWASRSDLHVTSV